MTSSPLNRRAVLGGTAVSALALAQAAAPRAMAGQAAATDAPFEYEVTRTEAEWREFLSPPEYVVLRKGSTELPKSNPLWKNTAKGSYCCRGCELTLYDSEWKSDVDKGWAFFEQSRENTVLLGIDGEPPYDTYGLPQERRFPSMIEAHCRRCGSHLGHILTVGDAGTLHCINGTSLQFIPATV